MKPSIAQWILLLVVIVATIPMALYHHIEASIGSFSLLPEESTHNLPVTANHHITGARQQPAFADQGYDVYGEQTEAEFRLENVNRLMSKPLSRLTAYQKHMIVEQILTELPFLVSSGELHPLDATLAHIRAKAHQQQSLPEYEVEAIRDEYIAMYPSDIRIKSHPEH
jgi:hypothetical protein